MSSKTFLILAAFLASVSVGSALKCYVCAGGETSDCAKGKASAMAITNCKSSGLDQTQRPHTYFNLPDSNQHIGDVNSVQLKAVCLKLYDNDYQPKLFARGCGLFPVNIDPCAFLQEHAHISGCKSCKTDLCNQRTAIQDDDDDLNTL